MFLKQALRWYPSAFEISVAGISPEYGAEANDQQQHYFHIVPWLVTHPRPYAKMSLDTVFA
jgi:hypothetical protein